MAEKEALPNEAAWRLLSACLVGDGGRSVVSRAGTVLLIETVRKSVLAAAIPAAPAPWRKPQTVHDSGKILLDLALATALGGDCPADGLAASGPKDEGGETASTSGSPTSQQG